MTRLSGSSGVRTVVFAFNPSPVSSSDSGTRCSHSDIVSQCVADIRVLCRLGFSDSISMRTSPFGTFCIFSMFLLFVSSWFSASACLFFSFSSRFCLRLLFAFDSFSIGFTLFNWRPNECSKLCSLFV